MILCGAMPPSIHSLMLADIVHWGVFVDIPRMLSYLKKLFLT